MTLHRVIRPATQADAPALEVLIRQLGYEESAADIAARLAQDAMRAPAGN